MGGALCVRDGADRRFVGPSGWPESGPRSGNRIMGAYWEGPCVVQALGKISAKVLVVEDDPIIRFSATSLVEDEGFEVLEADSADEAIAILEAHPEIRIVFTDIHMAGSMDGLQLAAYARDRWPPLRFIIVSGEKRPEEAEMPAGSCFFSKPYSLQAVGRALHGLVRP